MIFGVIVKSGLPSPTDYGFTASEICSCFVVSFTSVVGVSGQPPKHGNSEEAALPWLEQHSTCLTLPFDADYKKSNRRSALRCLRNALDDPAAGEKKEANNNQL